MGAKIVEGGGVCPEQSVFEESMKDGGLKQGVEEGRKNIRQKGCAVPLLL